MDLFNSIIDTTEQHLNVLMDNTYLSAIIKVLLIMYGCIIAPKLPTSVLRLLDNTFVKILFVILIIFMAKRDLGISLLIAIGFILTLQLINQNKLFNLNEVKNVFMGGDHYEQNELDISNEMSPEMSIDDMPCENISHEISNDMSYDMNMSTDMPVNMSNEMDMIADMPNETPNEMSNEMTMNYEPGGFDMDMTYATF